MDNGTKALTHLSRVQDLMDLSNYMDNPDLTEAMELALHCIADPNMPAATARKALLKMQGLAFQFRMQAATYTYINSGKAGTEQNVKKNIYFAVSEQCHELAQTLKYLAREQFGA